MEIKWQVNASDITRVKDLINKCQNNALVRNRLKRNCSAIKPSVSNGEFWQQMVSMRLTSQQNSSPGSPVGRLAREEPFPLSYDVIPKSKQAETFINGELQKWGGIRFRNVIAQQLSQNLLILEDGGWERTLKECNRLTVLVDRDIEVEVADYIQKMFLGFGPKQSRNLLQALGLTRREIPIDSRVTDWLNEFGFPVRLSAAGLADINYYNFVSDGIQELCAMSEVLPCILDASIFSLKDGDAWTDKNVY